MDIVSLLIQAISGAVGGNVAGSVLQKYNLGPVINSILGILGGGLGGQLLDLFTNGSVGSGNGALDLTSILGSIASGGVGWGTDGHRRAYQVEAEPVVSPRLSGPVVVPEVTLGVDPVPYPLLEYLGFGKAAVLLALPDLHFVASDPEHPAGPRFQGHLAEIVGEGAEQFLGQPGGTQQPLALSAVGDDDMRFTCGHDCTGLWKERSSL